MQRIELMRTDPQVSKGEARRTISGAQRDLFRLLVLNEGRPVSKEAIANLRGTDPNSVTGQIRNLRDQLNKIGCADLIKTEEAGNGYSASLDGWEIDCREYKESVDQREASLEDLLAKPLPPEEARRQIASLETAQKKWRSNPAEGLDEEGREYYDQFESLRAVQANRLLMARLFSGDSFQHREAIQVLNKMTRKEPDEMAWRLLLLVQHAKRNPISNLTEAIDKQYAGDVPGDLRDLMIRIGNKSPVDNPFRFEVRKDNTDAKPAPVLTGPVDETGLLKLCAMLGISTTSNLSLADSHIAPLACIRRTRSRLYFSGVLASKWVEKNKTPDVYGEFKQLLTRLDQEKGEVKFLIIDSGSPAFRRLHEMRDGQVSADSIGVLKELVAEHPSFQVRTFDTLPAFRIVAIDDDVLSFSPYRLGAVAYAKSGSGWQAPHIVLDPLADYPLAEAFHLLFSETWNKAKPLAKANMR